MIAYTTFLLCLVGILSSFKMSVKADKIFSFIILTLFSFVFLYFCNGFNNRFADVFSFVWRDSPGGSITVDIITSPYNCSLILPFFIITLFSVCNNTFYRYEEHRCNYNSILIFNLVALIIAITGNNFVQLLLAVFAIDILTMLIIKNAELYRRYMITNMVSNMMFFTVLAVLNSQLHSLNIREITTYLQFGEHLDFITVLGLTAVFMKLGFFLFHFGFSSLKYIRLHKMNDILFLSSPASALIILLKFHVLWSNSAHFSAYLYLTCLATAIWCFCGLLAIDNYKSKILYLQTLCMTLLVVLLKADNFIWKPAFSCFLLSAYLITQAFYLIFYYTNRHNAVSQIAVLSFTNKKSLSVALIFLVAALLSFAGVLLPIITDQNKFYLLAFAVLLTLAVSTVIQQIFFTRLDKLPKMSGKVSCRVFPMIMLFGLAGYLLLCTNPEIRVVTGITAIFTLLCRYSPLAAVSFRFYGISELQNFDAVGKLYRLLLLKPLNFCGRLLRIMIDWVLIEKIIVGTVSGGLQFCIRIFRKIHSSRFLGPVLFLVLSLILLWISFNIGGLS